MEIEKSIIYSSVGLAFAALSVNVNAAIDSAANLSIDAGYTVCVYGGTAPDSCTYGVTDTAGSWFAMDDGDNVIEAAEKTAISGLKGINLGTIQLATGSHAGDIDGTENPNIDNPWFFFNSTGMHQTTSAVAVLSDNGAGNVELDFRGWGVTWDGVDIYLGGGTANVPTDLGIAIVTCDVDCSIGESFILDYSVIIVPDDPSGYGGTLYTLYLEGTISAVPIPTTVWLFGSGLLALLTVSKQRNNAVR